MGHHYVPQKYLEGFAIHGEPKLIWMYDKSGDRQYKAAIKKVAQQRDYYTNDVERLLGANVELAGHKILMRLRRGEKFQESDRKHFALYVATMMRRVPRARRKALERYPAVVEKTLEEISSAINLWASGQPNRELVERRLEEFGRISARVKSEPPAEVAKQIKLPWGTSKMIDSISSMHWRFVEADGSELFVTSDNPAHYFDGFGLANVESEIIFPLSPRLALHGSRQGIGELSSVLRVSRNIVKEFNRRVISGAERFVFSHTEYSWIPIVGRKAWAKLNRVMW